MSYEEFLDLPVNLVVQLAQNLKFKRENDIPFSEEEEEIQEYLINYSQEIKLQEDKARLEYFWSIDSYEK